MCKKALYGAGGTTHWIEERSKNMKKIEFEEYKKAPYESQYSERELEIIQRVGQLALKEGSPVRFELFPEDKDAVEVRVVELQKTPSNPQRSR